MSIEDFKLTGQDRGSITGVGRRIGRAIATSSRKPARRTLRASTSPSGTPMEETASLVRADGCARIEKRYEFGS